jgi:hypothetical protein
MHQHQVEVRLFPLGLFDDTSNGSGYTKSNDRLVTGLERMWKKAVVA